MIMMIGDAGGDGSSGRGRSSTNKKGNARPRTTASTPTVMLSDHKNHEGGPPRNYFGGSSWSRSSSRGWWSIVSYCAGHRATRIYVLPVLVVAVGIAASTAFLILGIQAANEDELTTFQRTFEVSVWDLQETWYDYISTGLWLHEIQLVTSTATMAMTTEGSSYNSNSTSSDNTTIAASTASMRRRQAFREIYEHVTHNSTSEGGRIVEVQAVAFAPNVSNDERPLYEQEASLYYSQPEFKSTVNYTGIIGTEPIVGNESYSTIQRRSDQPYYFPFQYVEPVQGNEEIIGFDLLSCSQRRAAAFYAFETGTPAVTGRIKLWGRPGTITKGPVDPNNNNSYSVILLHPGTTYHGRQRSLKSSTRTDLTAVVVGISSLLKESASRWSMVGSSVYLFDATNTSIPPLFLGAANVESHSSIHFLAETNYTDILHQRLLQQQVINVGNRKWIMAAAPTNTSHVSSLSNVIVGAAIILAACVGIAVWVHTSAKRSERFNALKSAADADKAATTAERSLGDFVAHEVRNPLAAAISACTFVKSAVNEAKPLVDPTSRQATREDVDIVYNSLQYVNDLLRNMLEIHRATDKQLHVKLETTDVLRDVLEPVDSMLYRRNGRFQVHVQCPNDLYVTTDRLRLKQIVLNLALNSSKFIDGDGGYIKIGASVVDNGHVQLTVEDTGPGVPMDKRDRLFSKFQSSLDNLSQGTGVGLHLCKVLASLLGANIWLDDTYDSGLVGRPGAKFVIDLQKPPSPPPDTISSATDRTRGSGGSDRTMATRTSSSPSSDVDDDDDENDDDEMAAASKIPQELSVLFVDDDLVLRKLFTRTIAKVLPGWTVREAANGETAIRLVEDAWGGGAPGSSKPYDLIFVDQYMASYDKQLLGTETVTALRSRGIMCRICGLSANDTEREFLEAGADAFMFKPFPCERQALLDELHRILFGPSAWRSSARTSRTSEITV